MGVSSSGDCRPWSVNCCAESVHTANGPLECITEGPEVDRVVIPWVHSQNFTEMRSATALEQYRIRFYSYNMGNSSEFGSVDELQGPGGRGLFGTGFTDGFADGERCDVSFATFVETRLNFSDWSQSTCPGAANSWIAC